MMVNRDQEDVNTVICQLVSWFGEMIGAINCVPNQLVTGTEGGHVESCYHFCDGVEIIYNYLRKTLSSARHFSVGKFIIIAEGEEENICVLILVTN